MKKMMTATLKYQVTVDTDLDPMVPTNQRDLERYLRDNLGMPGYMRKGMEIAVLVPAGES